MPQWAPVAPAYKRCPGARYDVVGIGNALVDAIADAPDVFLDSHRLVKGSMELVDAARAVHLYGVLGTAVEMSGGSAANTMCGVASLGDGRRTSARCPATTSASCSATTSTCARRFRWVRDDVHADGALHHRRHARRPADDEHVPRRLQPAVGRLLDEP